ncbi:MAG: glycosyltransferase, partial [Cyanobacteria bacterium P01_A01_bin.83]
LQEHNLSGYLDIVVLPEFMEHHSDVVNEGKKTNQSQINFVPISSKERAELASRSSFFSSRKLSFQEWNLFCKYAKLLQSTQALLMYFDTYQLPILLGKAPPCPTSAIYFRPRFHYHEFDNHQYSLPERWHQKREKLHLTLVLRQRKLKTIFCLDPFAIKYLKRFKTSAKSIHLGDPVKTYQNYTLQPDEIRADLGIESKRKVFLLFGCLTRRKGLDQLLDALSLLPSTITHQICILLVGPISPSVKLKINPQIELLRQNKAIQVVICDRFISDQEIKPYFEIADFILAPYQRHVGMSAILARAAEAQKPVLSSDYGLMGELTRHYQLGLTVDSTVSSEIAQGITKLALSSPQEVCDFNQMKAFAEQNNPHRFAEVIFQNLSCDHWSKPTKTNNELSS